MTHTPAQRSKRTLAWKRVRARAKNPQTRKALRVFIQREIAAACAPLLAKPDWETERAAIEQSCREFFESLAPGPLRQIEVVGSTFDAEAGRLTTTVSVPAWLAIEAGLSTEETPTP